MNGGSKNWPVKISNLQLQPEIYEKKKIASLCLFHSKNSNVNVVTKWNSIKMRCVGVAMTSQCAWGHMTWWHHASAVSDYKTQQLNEERWETINIIWITEQHILAFQRSESRRKLNPPVGSGLTWCFRRWKTWSDCWMLLVVEAQKWQESIVKVTAA